MKTRTTWLILGAALTVVLAVMAWVTATLVRLDASHTQAQREGVVQEQARLALWRVDSAMTPILAREVALLDAPPQAASLPTPPPGVLMRFELGADGLSPRTEATADQVARLEGVLELDALLAALAHEDPLAVASAEVEDKLAAEPYALKTQALRNEGEWGKRRASTEDNLVAQGYGYGDPEATNSLSPGPSPRAGDGFAEAPAKGATTVIRALWIGGELVLIRGAGAEARERVEGTWLDWPRLQVLLLEDVADLLPRAQLVPVLDPSSAEIEHMLATLPARLVPGATIAPPQTWSPLRASLVAAWLIVLGAFSALVLLVRASSALSERRATFVSAVTHELRTPLTTFRMYTQMLSEGMVEHKRERYLAVLRREADRLSALVENVLAYAQIESERGATKREPVRVGAVLDRVVDGLRERCEAAELELELDVDPSDRAVEIAVDVAALEQILFNLVDNAAKYGIPRDQALEPGPDQDPDPRWIGLHLEVGPRRVELHVRDRGPGVAPEDRRRIFEPFTKAKADASGTKPGVGLGLALSRRLARQMGGDLQLGPHGPGADFFVSLPRS